MWKFICKTTMLVFFLSLPLILRMSATDNHEKYLLLSALFMVVYFLLPVIKKRAVMLLILGSVLVWLQALVGGTEQFVLVGVFFILLLEAMESLDKKAYVIISMLLLILLVIGQLVTPFQFVNLLLSVTATSFFAFVLWGYKQVKERNEELYSLYESLLGEYRQLKRETNSFAEQARTEERTRIARDIHDSVGHQLTALLMQLEMGKLAVHSQQDIAQMIDVAKEIANNSLQETRKAVKALQVEEPSGIASVIHLIKKLETRNLKIGFTTKHGVLNMKLSSEANIVLYRTIQEALTNAMRHGNGKQIEIILELIATRSVRLTMKNESHASGKVYEGFGLSAMRERIEEIGGQMSVYQKEGSFYLIAVLPLEGKETRGKDYHC